MPYSSSLDDLHCMCRCICLMQLTLACVVRSPRYALLSQNLCGMRQEKDLNHLLSLPAFENLPTRT